MVYRIVLLGSEGEQDSFECTEDQTVLAAAQQAGLAPDKLPVGCRAGGCGVCKLQVLEGDIRAGAMSTARVSTEERAEGWALACRIYPESDLRVRL